MSDIQFVREPIGSMRIVVVGIGGGGCNLVEPISRSGLKDVDFYAVNTDKQALERLDGPQKILIGFDVTKGLGTGGNHELGRKAAEADRDAIVTALEGADMVFIVAGLGGGTGTGGAPVVGEIAKQLGALVVGIVTMPFEFEGAKRNTIADEGLVYLKQCVDTIHIIRNQKLFSVLQRDASIANAFEIVNKQIRAEIEGIYEIITKTGIINLDFADVRSVMFDSGGEALIGTGFGKGENAASLAVRAAIESPFVEEYYLEGARRGLVNFTAHLDYPIFELQSAINFVKNLGGFNDGFSFGLVADENLQQDEVRVIVIATGFDSTSLAKSDSDKTIRVMVKPAEYTRETKVIPIDTAKTGSTSFIDAEKPDEPKSEPMPKPEEKKQEKSFADASFKPVVGEDFELPAFMRKKSQQ